MSDLEKLLVPVEGMNAEEMEQLGRELYRSVYLNNGHYGVHRTHDEQVLLFHESQFEHAFYTTSDRHCHPERKDVLRRGQYRAPALDRSIGFGMRARFSML